MSYLSGMTRVNFEYHEQFHIFSIRIRSYGIIKKWRTDQLPKKIDDRTQLVADVRIEHCSLILGGFIVGVAIALFILLIEILF